MLLVVQPQVVPRLNASLPVFIEADSWEESAEELDDIFLGDAEIWWVGGGDQGLGGRGGEWEGRCGSGC